MGIRRPAALGGCRCLALLAGGVSLARVTCIAGARGRRHRLRRPSPLRANSAADRSRGFLAGIGDAAGAGIPAAWKRLDDDVVRAAVLDARRLRRDSYRARRLRAQRDAWWLLLSFAIVFGAYGKYSIGLLAAAASPIGLLVTPRTARVLRTPWPVFAAGIAWCCWLPNLLWQATHGWPIVEVLRGDAAHRPAFQSGFALEFTDFARNAAAFGLEQILYANLVAAPVWLAGIVAPFRVTALRDLRFRFDRVLRRLRNGGCARRQRLLYHRHLRVAPGRRRRRRRTRGEVAADCARCRC